MQTDEKSSGPGAPASQSIAIIPISLALAVAALLLFVGLSQEVLRSGTDRFDESIRAAVHAHASPALTGFFRALTNLGDWMVLVPACLLVGLFFYLRGLRQHLRLLLVTMAGALLLDAVLKVVVRRPRPVPFFIPEPSTYSFPSGHALVSFCFYGLLAGMTALQLKAWWQKAVVWTGAGVLIGLIGLSRIYLGVHWPSDVVAGYAAAIVWLGAIRGVALREGKDGGTRK